MNYIMFNKTMWNNYCFLFLFCCCCCTSGSSLYQFSLEKKTIRFYYFVPTFRYTYIYYCSNNNNKNTKTKSRNAPLCRRCGDTNIIGRFGYNYINIIISWHNVTLDKNIIEKERETILLYKHLPSGHVLRLVTLLRLLVEHFAGRTALFSGGDAVETHVELLTVVWVREHGVGHVLATAVVHLIFGAREAVFQFHYNTIVVRENKDTNNNVTTGTVTREFGFFFFFGGGGGVQKTWWSL